MGQLEIKKVSNPQLLTLKSLHLLFYEPAKRGHLLRSLASTKFDSIFISLVSCDAILYRPLRIENNTQLHVIWCCISLQHPCTDGSSVTWSLWLISWNSLIVLFGSWFIITCMRYTECLDIGVRCLHTRSQLTESYQARLFLEPLQVDTLGIQINVKQLGKLHFTSCKSSKPLWVVRILSLYWPWIGFSTDQCWWHPEGRDIISLTSQSTSSTPAAVKADKMTSPGDESSQSSPKNFWVTPTLLSILHSWLSVINRTAISGHRRSRYTNWGIQSR